MNIEESRKLERDKYESIYVDKDQHYRKKNDSRGYGRENHGKNIMSYILRIKPTSVLDIGCGFGNFCDSIEKSGVEKVYGMDIASVKTGNVIDNPNIKFIDGEAHQLPFEDNSIDIITSFDCLEHCLENDIDVIFAEMNRVVKNRCVFSIAYRQSGEDTNGVILHMTVKPESWWIEKLNKLFTVEKSGGYLICIKR
jgi:ubiquinone/menaquinone biosynthesis C-methylase UbiE